MKDTIQSKQIDALTKANIKHTAFQSAFKRSLTLVCVNRKDYNNAETVLGNDAYTRGGNLWLGIDDKGVKKNV